jgi:cytochrome c-type biogenesis protein CcmH/NrfG
VTFRLVGADRNFYPRFRSFGVWDQAICQPPPPRSSQARPRFYKTPTAKHTVDRALEAFDVAPRGLAGDEELVSGIGYVYRRQGRFEEAAEKLREAARLNPQDTSAYRNLGETTTCLRQFDDAISAYEQVIIIAPEAPAS